MGVLVEGARHRRISVQLFQFLLVREIVILVRIRCRILHYLHLLLRFPLLLELHALSRREAIVIILIILLL